MTQIDPITELLAQSKTIAVVGLSDNPARPSFEVAHALQAMGYRVVPVNPNVTEVLGEKSYATVTEAAAKCGAKIDIVDVFRRSEDTVPIAHEAVVVGARCLWLQLGVVNEEAAKIAHAGGLEVVMDRCLKIEARARR